MFSLKMNNNLYFHALILLTLINLQKCERRKWTPSIIELRKLRENSGPKKFKLFAPDFRLIVKENGKEFNYKFKDGHHSLECKLLAYKVKQGKMIGCNGKESPPKKSLPSVSARGLINLSRDIESSNTVLPRKPILVTSLHIITSIQPPSHIDIVLSKERRIKSIDSIDLLRALKEALEPIQFSWMSSNNTKEGSHGFINKVLVSESSSHFKMNRLLIRIKPIGWTKESKESLRLQQTSYAALLRVLESRVYEFELPYVSTSSSCRLRIGLFFDRPFLLKIMKRYGIHKVLPRSSFIATEILLIAETLLSGLLPCQLVVTSYKFMSYETLNYFPPRQYMNNVAQRETAHTTNTWDLGLIFSWSTGTISNLGSICSQRPRDAFALISFKIPRIKGGNDFERMAAVVAHEVAHSLGLKHDSCERESFMAPRQSPAHRKWSGCARKHLDLDRLNCLYS